MPSKHFILLVILTLALPAFAQESATCGSSPSPALVIGEFGRVADGESNNLRDSPSANGALLGQIGAGQTFRVLDGPVCADGYNWWQVKYNEQIAWTVEGADGEYWLLPLEPAPILENPFRNPEIAFDNQVQLGVHVRVRASGNDSVNARTEAFADAEIVASYLNNTILEIIGEAVERDGLRWWLVRDASGLAGWMAEGTLVYGKYSASFVPLCPYIENRIAFFSYDTNLDSYNLYTMNPSGTELCNMLYYSGFGDVPYMRQIAWSPDGSQLAFISNIFTAQTSSGNLRGGHALLNVINPDGSDLRPIASDLFSLSFSWAPDSSQIAIAGVPYSAVGTPDFADVWRVNADGTGAAKLTGGENHVYYVAWSPAGEEIAFSNEIRNENDSRTGDVLGLIGRGGGNVEVVLESTEALKPTWSPDGAYLAFAALNTDDSTMFTVYNRSTDSFTFDTTENRMTSPAWSPDASQIALWRYEDRRWTLNLYAPSIENLQVLAESTALEFGSSALWFSATEILFANEGAGIMRWNIESGIYETILNAHCLASVGLSYQGNS